MLRNAPIRLKLLLMLILPLIGFLTFSSFYVANRYHILLAMNRTVAAGATTQRVCELISALQRERGASGVVLGSAGKSMKDKLEIFRQQSDQHLNTLSVNDAPMAAVMESLEVLPELRNKVDALALGATESGAQYTSIIEGLIRYTYSLEASVDNAEILRALATLNVFVEMKERAGRERFLLALGFTQNRVDASLLTRISKNLGEFSAYFDTFMDTAPEAFQQRIQALTRQPVSNDVTKFQQLLLETPVGEPLGVKPEDWFNVSTQRIDLMSGMEAELAQAAGGLAGQARAEAGRAVWLAAGAVLIVLLALAALAYAISQNIKQGVGEVNRALVALATRNLTARSSYQGRDEFAAISRNVNGMAQEIQVLIQEIANSTVQIASAAEQSSAIALQTNQNVAQQRQGTEQVATAINEMSATVKDVARSTTEAAELSQRVNSSAALGKAEIEVTIGLVEGLSVQAEQTSHTVAELKTNSDTISSVLDVIRGIADQTNLLALNAAIEAARAGEAGRGFAVVADEVRTLARRTQESTGNIQSMITKLQAGADKASGSMKETLGRVQAGASNVVRAGDLLVEIANGITRISDRNIQVASAAEEQSVVAEEISRNVSDINDLVVQVSAGAEQTAATSRELARLAEHQRALVGRFRI
ncbi:methyl-accepting chemotaxis protein [Pseudomonas sp. C2L12B]|nr:methyl-accepting chemotaxis protein [Pseudomonas typographi]MBD1586874.1 methyl-accepting chemotaxis protein [Pseudomonas typographi]